MKAIMTPVTATLNYAELLKGIAIGNWVAISNERHAVISVGPNAVKVLSEARERGERHPLILRVHDAKKAYFL